MRIKITKIATSDNPKYPTPSSMQDYEMGKENKDVSLPCEYWLIGHLAYPIQVGSPVVVYRDVRNGVECSGLFKTSPVQSWDGKTFTTTNSIYKVESF